MPFPMHTTPGASNDFRVQIDHPVDWSRAPRFLLMRGWCVDSDGKPPTGIRLRAGEATYSGSVELPRPDVAAALPGVSHSTGFEIRAVLPSGSNQLVIEARTEGGDWISVWEKTIHVRRRFRPRWLAGGDAAELLAFQLPAHAVHEPRPLRSERFPAAGRPDSPAFCIVTPSYNQAPYLAETAGSVLSQGVRGTYHVQDGGSTDGSAALLAQLEKARTAHTHGAGLDFTWESVPDGGQAEAIARAFARTSSGPDDLMAWINSDDFYLPGALEYVAAYFAAHPEVDVLYGHRVLVDESSREIGRWFLPPHDDDVLRLNDFVPQETLFWRRRVWEKVGGIDPSFQFAMDWDLLLRFQAAGACIVRVPRFLASFRIHAAQKTAAQINTVGQIEIDRLRCRAQGRPISPLELEHHPTLQRYLRRSALIEFLWSLGLRAP